MKDEFELRIGPGGIVESVYQDGLVDAIGAKTLAVERASNVEWEKTNDPSVFGWTVRSAQDPALAIGIAPDGSYKVIRSGSVVYFAKREFALEQEVAHFWELYACSRHKIVGCMACRYGTGPLANPNDYEEKGIWFCGIHRTPLDGGEYGYCINCGKMAAERTGA